MATFGNQTTFRPGQGDYSVLAQDGMDDLMPPDIRAELSGQFQNAGQEVTVPVEEQEEEAARSGQKDGNGAAVLDGAPKPTPGDEFASVVYGRAPDASTDYDMMVGLGAAVAIGAAFGRDDAQDGSTPASVEPQTFDAPDPAAQLEGMTPHHPDYSVLQQENDALTLDTQPAELNDLMPPETRNELQAGFNGAEQEINGSREVTDAGLEQDNMADLMPPDIRADVAATNYQQSQQLTGGLGL